MLESIGIMNKKFEEEFLVWILEDDELQQSKKVKATSNLKRAINKLQASVEESKKHMHPLDRLLSMPSIMDDYNSKIDAISNIKARLEDSMELVSYLHKTKTYEFYRLIIDYVENHLTPISLSNNEDDIAFFIVKSELASIMKSKGIAGSTRINLKLNSLCELGLLSKNVTFTNSYIKEAYDSYFNYSKQRSIIQRESHKLTAQALAQKTKIRTTNPFNYIEVSNLSPDVITQYNSIISIKCRKIKDICDIYRLYYSAKLDALKEYNCQNINILAAAVNEIIKEEKKNND